jgi:histidinol-phosphate phosphatase family protein
MAQNQKQPLTALVLAGGEGTRLRAAVPGRQKVVAEVDGRPFLLYLLEQLNPQIVSKIVICTGYLHAQVAELIGDNSRGIPITYSFETERLGTAGAIRNALPHIETSDVLVMNGDSYCGFNLEQYCAAHLRHAATASLLLTRVPDISRYGEVVVADDGRVTQFAEKTNVARAGLINAGVYLLKRELIERIPAGRSVSLEKEIFPSILNEKVFAFESNGAFIDIGVPDDYARAHEFLRQARATRPIVALDRDGTVIAERNYLKSIDEVELLPGAIEGMRKLIASGFDLILITNQSGVGRGYFDAACVDGVHAHLKDLLAKHGIYFQGVYYCPHTPEDACDCRKPKPGMILQAAAELKFDPALCTVIGDKPCDIDLGKAVGAQTILVRTGYGAKHESEGVDASYIATDLVDAANWIAANQRK